MNLDITEYSYYTELNIKSHGTMQSEHQPTNMNSLTVNINNISGDEKQTK